MLKLAFIVSVFAGSATAKTDPVTLMQNTSDLTAIIGSEEFCGYTLDQPSIEQWMLQNVQADDAGFASTLNLLISGQMVQNQQMSR